MSNSGETTAPKCFASSTARADVSKTSSIRVRIPCGAPTFQSDSLPQVPDPTIRLYAIVRSDLGMSPGKTASQAGHAYLGAFIHANSELQSAYHAEFPEHPGTKICLTAKNLNHLLNAKELAEASGIPTYLVTDTGCENFFNGEPTITALGLGPATKDQIKHITRRFQLM